MNSPLQIPHKKYTVKYFQPELDKGFKIEKRYGSNSIINYNNGVVLYDQYDHFDSIDECSKFIKEKSKITISDGISKKYINFSIIKN